MRISTSTMTKMMTGSISDAYSDYFNVINKIASKKNFTKVSENPTDAAKVLKLKDQMASIENYQSNIKAATNEMNLAYDTLGEITDELSAIKDKVLEASNGSTTPDSAKALASEIKERVSTVQDKMNTKYMDNFIFSGTYIYEQPYVETNTGISYQGSSKTSGDRNLTIAEGKVFSYNFTGEEIFGESDGINDFFAQMKDLDKLLNEDPLKYEEIRKKIDVIDSSVNNITKVQGEVSAKVTALDKAYESNTDTLTKLTTDRSDLEDVDIIKAASDLANAQQALQASYTIGSQILGSVSLLDYI